MMIKRYGFTLIELLITVLLIGILSSISVITMRSMAIRAIVCEAEAGLGAIRSALIQYSAEHAAYPGVAGPWYWIIQVATGPAPSDSSSSNWVPNPGWLPGLILRTDNTSLSSLDGAYFSQDCYSFRFDTTDSGYIMCSIQYLGPWKQPPKWFTTVNIADNPWQNGIIYMNIKTGKFYQQGITRSGLPLYGTDPA